MFSTFESFNLYVYNSLVGRFLDLVIWCLGPVVDSSREYGLLRRYLAIATCTACRNWYGIQD